MLLNHQFCTGLINKMNSMTRTSERLLARLSRTLISISLFFLMATVTTPVFCMQEAESDFDPDPLRLADTSSPRATLRSFLTNATKAIEDFSRNQGVMSAAGLRARQRAVQTLDFSTTPDSSADFIRSRRTLYLKEILDRIEVPPDNEIPGASEVADGTITQWTLPDAQITIQRIERGPRAGEFLFSADTVQRLDRLYRQVKHLPYKPQATTPGAYEAFIQSQRTSFSYGSEVRGRLRPVDTSSPRSTLEGFLHSVNRAYARIMQAEAALTATPPTMTKEEAREIERAADDRLKRAIATLDLSQVPEALRKDVGLEAVLQLKEVFDRMPLPPLDSVPNVHFVAAAREGAGGSSSRTAGPFRWRYPNTAIEIVEIMEGERQGQFLFSAGTVNRIGDFYEEIKDLPYRGDDYGTRSFQYNSPDKSEGFYEHYITTPGVLISRTHLLANLIDSLPDRFKQVHGGQTVWQWIALTLTVLALVLVSYMVLRVMARLTRRLSDAWDDWLSVLTPIIVAVITFITVGFIDKSLNITGSVLTAVNIGGITIVLAMVAWAVYILCKAVAETIITLPRIPERGLDATLLRIGARVVGFLLGAWIFIGGIRYLGADVVPLLAGLGVGGLALALAAQSTIANFIGSLILLVNRPVRVGDFCRYGEDPSPGWLRIGTVEEIGLISTRLRGIDRTVTTIPNAEFSKMHIVNLTQRDRRLLRTKLRLRIHLSESRSRS